MNKKYLFAGLVGSGLVASGAIFKAFARISIPEGAKAVQPFRKEKFLGNWYEIARIDFKHEKGLSHVTASYSAKTANSIRVENRGYDAAHHKWKESTGKARFVKDETIGRLKVSFFGPFYAGYNVIAIDDKYRYALIAGNNLDYLWMLSREQTIPEDVKNDYLEKAKAIGYDTDRLIYWQITT